MKRFLVFLGVIAFVFLAILGSGIVYGTHLYYVLTPSGKAYADESIRAIVTTWSKDELIKRSSPEFRAVTTRGELEQFFVDLNKLGSFQRCGGAQGRLDFSLSFKKGFIITATYYALATFQYGKADITIKLIRHNHAWQIAGFHADRPPPLYQ